MPAGARETMAAHARVRCSGGRLGRLTCGPAEITQRFVDVVVVCHLECNGEPGLELCYHCIVLWYNALSVRMRGEVH